MVKLVENPLGKWYERIAPGEKVEEADEVWGSKVLYRFYGSKDFPIEWKTETEKKIHWVISDLHTPHPASPLYVEVCGWGDGDRTGAPAYMYRRFWAPIGSLWPLKIANGYIYHGMIPPDPDTIEASAKYYSTVMPIYADQFLGWWDDRLLPEMKRNLDYLDNYPYEESSLEELLVLFEDAIDIFDQHWRLHWVLNLAQFQSFIMFKEVFTRVFGKPDEELANRVLVSIADKNWEAIEGLWELKEFVKGSPILKELFESGKTKDEIIDTCKKGGGKEREFLKRFNDYLDEFGWKAMYSHELVYPSWREEPTPVIEQIRTYLAMDYSYPKDIARCEKDQSDAVNEVWERAEKENMSGEDKAKLRKAMDLAVKMAPLTPDHHFYIDQGTHQRVRRVALEIGKKLVAKNVIERPDDVPFLRYNELREIGTNPKAFDAKSLVMERREEREEAEKILPAPFIGTVTEWSLHQEPYKIGLWGWTDEKFERAKKQIEEGMIGKPTISKRAAIGDKTILGIPASPGIAEGIARIVTSPAEFNRVEDGTIMFCDMTNPAWVPIFPKLRGLVTNSGGVLAHPAIVSREFGIPCIVGTLVGTEQITDGQKVRINGNMGTVEIL